MPFWRVKTNVAADKARDEKFMLDLAQILTDLGFGIQAEYNMVQLEMGQTMLFGKTTDPVCQITLKIAMGDMTPLGYDKNKAIAPKVSQLVSDTFSLIY